MRVQGSWSVRYTDGSELRQWDATHPRAVHGEVPLRCIEWDRVRQLVFESQYAGVHVYDCAGVPPGCQLKLRMRTLQAGGNSLVCMLMCTERAGAVDPPPPEDVLSVLYWVPDGSSHHCHGMRCEAVQQYVQQLLWGRTRVPLTPNHECMQVAADAVAM